MPKLFTVLAAPPEIAGHEQLHTTGPILKLESVVAGILDYL